jgi:F-box/leucine-rich repeat protein 2/20
MLNACLQTSVPLPADIRPSSRGTFLEPTSELPEVLRDTDPLETREEEVVESRKIDFWLDMPIEIKMAVFQYLSPKELVRCSRVSKSWNSMCFDGQLWASLDTSVYYRDIPSEALVKIITSAGPFLRDLNLRGCIQLQEAWISDGERISDACRNLVNISIEDCRIDKTSIRYFLIRNPNLVHINLSGLTTVTNSAMKIISQSCPNLEYLNVSWCKAVDTKGLKRVVASCPRLKDLRAGELLGFDDDGFMLELFKTNKLERLILSHCSSLTDASLKALLHGVNPEIDFLTDRPIVPPRKLRHLDLSRCRGLTDVSLKHLAHNVPNLEGLQLSHCPNFGDDALSEVIRTTLRLTHLDLEELENLTNAALLELSKAPCATHLEHLNISYCEKLGDTGMLQILKNCPRLRSLDLDNTRVSDLTIMEICAQVRKRGFGSRTPRLGLRVAVFDCGNITWAGVREVLSSNTFVPRLGQSTTASAPSQSDTSLPTPPGSTTPLPSALLASVISFGTEMYPKEIIQLKCFYGWQMTVDEHTKRVLRGNLAAAIRLERKWADYMMANEEAGAGGAGARRRRRRAREVERLYNADEDDGDGYGPAGLGPLGGRRRRARSGGCVVM